LDLLPERKNKMHKLLNKFIIDPTEKNAVRLISYINKHPFSMLTASTSVNEIIGQAREIAGWRIYKA